MFTNAIISGYIVILNSTNYSDVSLVTNNSGEITIKNKVTEIAPSTFISGKFGPDKITSILFDKDSYLKIISSQSFQNITSLKSLNIPKSVISIGKLAFASLQNSAINLFPKESHLENIGDYTFASLNLQSLNISSSIISIGSSAFLNSTFNNNQLFFQGTDPLIILIVNYF